MTIQDAASALRERRVSSVELTRDSLARIQKLNPGNNSFITVTAEHALHRAAELDQRSSDGKPCGPLCGVPIALKDVICQRGVRTTCGSKILSDYIPDFDAAVTEKLVSAGAVIAGKTNLHEFAYGVTSDNPHYGAVRNPWNLHRIPGGSSGGSAAAVSSGMVYAAIGSDTGGSIRIPASYCGVVGLKPTSGRVSRFGVIPLDFSLDHIGPITRTVGDARLLLSVIAGHDLRDDSSSRRLFPSNESANPPSLKGVRIGWPERFFFERVDPQVEAAVFRAARAAEALGAIVVPVSLPDIAELNILGRLILMCEAAAVLGKFWRRREDFGEDVRLLVEQGLLLPASDYINAQRLRRMLQREFRAVWRNIDCLVTPTTPITAPRIGTAHVVVNGTPEDVRLASTRFTRAFNVLGLPAISIPCGWSTTPMPIGMQIVTEAFTETKLLGIAEGWESALAFGDTVPLPARTCTR